MSTQKNTKEGNQRLLYAYTAIVAKIAMGKEVANAACCGEKFFLVSIIFGSFQFYQPNIQAKIKGTTIVASLSTINFGVWMSSFPQVIFSLGTAPE